MVKPWKSLGDQVSLLQSRGMKIHDVEAAKRWLSLYGLYRFYAYAYPFRKIKSSLPPIGSVSYRRDDFINNCHFSDVTRLYDYDRKLRNITFQGIKSLELRLRVATAHMLGKRDPLGHLHQKYWQKLDEHRKWEIRYLQRIDQAHNNSDFIKHYSYNNRKPEIWVATEIWDFGLLYHCFKGLKSHIQKDIMNFMGLDIHITPNIFEQWLKVINIIRNICAHHSRLWNISLPRGQAFSKSSDLTLQSFSSISEKDRFFYYASVLAYLISQTTNDRSWCSEMKQLLLHLPEPTNSRAYHIRDMGLYLGWENSNLIWK